jgi:hypothetical protein
MITYMHIPLADKEYNDFLMSTRVPVVMKSIAYSLIEKGNWVRCGS